MEIKEIKEIKKILVYKRDHTGDPNEETGVFGINTCMGKIRDWGYQAVIGIGGKNIRKNDKDIKHKINWIGIFPVKASKDIWDEENLRGSRVAFKNFKLYEEKGEEITEDNYPILYNLMYSKNVRNVMYHEEKLLEELHQILDLAKDANSSKALKDDGKTIDVDLINKFKNEQQEDIDSDDIFCCTGGVC